MWFESFVNLWHNFIWEFVVLPNRSKLPSCNFEEQTVANLRVCVQNATSWVLLVSMDFVNNYEQLVFAHNLSHFYSFLHRFLNSVRIYRVVSAGCEGSFFFLALHELHKLISFVLFLHFKMCIFLYFISIKVLHDSSSGFSFLLRWWFHESAYFYIKKLFYRFLFVSIRFPSLRI